MNETTKSHQRRIDNKDYENYIRGSILDIGCGTDSVNSPFGTTIEWEKYDGDGQFLEGVKDNTFDTVYASHTLEHIRDVEICLTNWIRVLKPNGFLYIVIPDFDLYEKGIWPSIFNGDHKHSFSINKTRKETNRDNHYNICLDLMPILRKLGVAIKEIRLEDFNFDYSNPRYDLEKKDTGYQICIICKKEER